MSLKNLRVAFLALFLVGTAIAFPVTARAETKIVVVDFQRILTESKAGKGLQAEIDAQQKSYQEDVAKQEASLQVMLDQINKEQATSKSATDVIQKKADFEKKRVDAQQAMQKKRETIEKAANTAVTDLRNQAAQIIGDMATRDKYNLVLNRATVVMAEKSMDITDSVLKELDAKVTKVDLKLDTASAK